jgi:hypothetical protein
MQTLRDAYFFLQENGYINFGVVKGALTSQVQACLMIGLQAQPPQHVRHPCVQSPLGSHTDAPLLSLSLLLQSAQLRRSRQQQLSLLRMTRRLPSSCMNCCAQLTCRCAGGVDVQRATAAAAAPAVGHQRPTTHVRQLCS